VNGNGKSGASIPLELRPDNRRIEGFSDGVFAVAVTIIVLEVRVPGNLAFANDAAAFQQFVSLLAIYALSFVVVGILWANHHYLLSTLPCTDRAAIWFNNHVLFWVTMVPVAARFFGAHPAETPCITDKCQSVSPRSPPPSFPESLDRDCRVCRGYPAGICRCEAKLGTSYHSARAVLSSNRSRERHPPVMSAFHP
jgi:hypothetical protein